MKEREKNSIFSSTFSKKAQFDWFNGDSMAMHCVK